MIRFGAALHEDRPDDDQVREEDAADSGGQAEPDHLGQANGERT